MPAGTASSHIWLVVNPEQYPYYEGRTGSIDKPDTTHFQEYGANALTQVVVEHIKTEPKLKKLAREL